jgi:predicted enzyme related to lactoylglutathione lyase
MGEVSRYPRGTFCWVDLGTTDVDGAKRFYSELLGWTIEDVDTPDGVYSIARIDGKDVAGMHAHEPGDVHNWDSYISVDDLDSALERVRKLGGQVSSGPHEIPGSARMAVITDGGGARTCLWQAAGYTGAQLVNETGTWSWNDLSTRDPGAAEAFFSKLFGWSSREVAPGYWSISMSDLLIGGMRTMDNDPEGTPPNWMPYFVVEDAEKVAAQVQELGGRILVPPTEVPAGRFLVATDPLSAWCGLLEMGPEGPARGVDRL